MPVTIVVEPGTLDCLNLGDVAMLETTITRLRALAPTAELHVVTQDAQALQRHCPEVLPLSDSARREWTSENLLLGRLLGFLPRPVRAVLGRGIHYLRRQEPYLLDRLLELRLRLGRLPRNDLLAFRDVMRKADLLVLAGQHTFADTCPNKCRVTLATVELALGYGVPVAMFGQAVGPLEDPELRRWAEKLLPACQFIAIREQDTSWPLLASLGVLSSRVAFTGDDAVPLALAARDERPGNHIGVSLRVTPVAGVAEAAVSQVRAPLHAFARERNARLIPLPSAHHGIARDVDTLQRVLHGYDHHSDGGAELDTPRKVIAAAARCRIIVAGAYHAAVFALAQGIPVVCVGESPYYMSKFHGLQSQFGEGCAVVKLNEPRFAQHLRDAMLRLWNQADDLRSELLAIASEQSDLGYAAYLRLADLLPEEQLDTVASPAIDWARHSTAPAA